jgi:hypothetical protein
VRLRLPAGERIRSVSPHRPFDVASGTIDLTGAVLPVDLVVRTT